jgi:hypothetical protein
MARKGGVVSDVLGNHRFTQPISADENDIAAFLDKIESEGMLDNDAINLPWPVPVEVGHRFETTYAGEPQAVFEA